MLKKHDACLLYVYMLVYEKNMYLHKTGSRVCFGLYYTFVVHSTILVNGVDTQLSNMCVCGGVVVFIGDIFSVFALKLVVDARGC